MRRIAVITRVGQSDKNAVPFSKDTDLVVNLPVFDSSLGAENRVTHEKIFGEIKRLGLELPEPAVDLLFLGISVYAADTRIVRGRESQDGWTREIDLHVPVSNPTEWTQRKPQLEDLLHFLTGDYWRIFFRSRAGKMSHIALKPKERKVYETDTLCLFSGGLDSFVGAINLLESGTIPVFLRHHSTPDVSAPQKTTEEFLRKKYGSTPPEFIDAFVRIPTKPFNEAYEDTTRGRSFLFLSLGAAFASSLSMKARLVVPENGFISLNVPLTSLRLGSLTTRTTHPYFVSGFQTLLQAVGLNVTLDNPYQFKTKGEMLRECRNQKVLKAGMADTMSCSHPAAGRFAGRSFGHCGYCVPCIIRQAAFKKAYGSDPTSYRVKVSSKQLDPQSSEGEQVRAFKIAASRPLSDTETSKLMIRLSGPLPADANFLDNAAGIYQRGMKEVTDFLSNVKTK